ncbi:uncharacterized protein isoform X3 [Choristoneura fumiferana]|uniref:uncharacterized protein isoform X3 n=1 Tax=Choristoneura fumiferana TaxID=7141 RepID=UPI003D15B9D8
MLTRNVPKCAPRCAVSSLCSPRHGSGGASPSCLYTPATRSSHINKEPKQSNHKGVPCVVCRGEHRIYDCKIFRHLTVDERWAQASKLQLCHVCLRPDHETRQCKLNGCRVYP